MLQPSRPGSFWPQWEENRLFALLLAILLVYGIVFLGAEIRKTMTETNNLGIADQAPPTITVTAFGESVVAPDIATVDLGITTTAKTANEASDDNNETMSALIAGLKALGIEEKDLKTTGYNVNPNYDYSVSPQVLVDYSAYQNLTVRVRNKELVNVVLDTAGNLGATNIGGLRFESDDPSLAEAEAREEAIEKAYEQALAITDAMGARLGGVVSYSESSGQPYAPYYGYADYALTSESRAGANVQPGEEDVSMTVYITYSIR